MSKKIFGDTDYYTTKELFDHKAKNGKHYDSEVNKVTNDLVPSGQFFTLFTEDDPFKAYIQWYGTFYFELPFDNGFDWRTFITYTKDLDVADRRCALFALFAAKNEQSEKWTYRFYDGKIYFLRDDFFAIEDYMEIDLPVEELPSEYTKSVVSTLLTLLADNGTQKNNIRKDDLKYLYTVNFPEITRKIYSYNRTWDGWFGYILQPNFKDRFLSYDDYLKADGTVIKTVRISEWNWETKENEVQGACQALQVEYDSDNLEDVYKYNKLVYECLVTAGYLEIKDDINRIYANTDWCLRNDLANIFNKLEIFQLCVNTINAKTGEHNRGMETKLIKYIHEILTSFSLKFQKLKRDIMKNSDPVEWYPNIQNVSSRSEYWKSLYDLFNVGITTLAVDYETYFNNGYKWLYGPIREGSLNNLVLVNNIKKQDNSVEITRSEHTTGENEEQYTWYEYDVDDRKIITTTRIEKDYLGNEYMFNIQQYFYYLMEYYYRREYDPEYPDANDYRPVEIYASAFDLVPDLLEDNILAFLQSDIQKMGQFVFNDQTQYTSQEALRNLLGLKKYVVDDISYFERIWEMFTLPDTINRYAVSKCKISREMPLINTSSMMSYAFVPGRTSNDTFTYGNGVVELYLSTNPITDLIENYDQLIRFSSLILVAPSTNYSEAEQDEDHTPWILKGHALTNNTLKTADLVKLINNSIEKTLYKVYMFVFKVNDEIIRFPRLEFDFTGVPYTVAPEIPELDNIEQNVYFNFITSVNSIERQMALVMKSICDKCTTIVKQFPNNNSIYQLECYDQEELRKFYDTFSVFIEFEDQLQYALSSLVQNTWFQNIISRLSTTAQNLYALRITGGRYSLDGDFLPVQYVSTLRSAFNSIVQKESLKYYYYNIGTTSSPSYLSPEITNSFYKSIYWDRASDWLESFITGLDKNPPYISDIRVYSKAPEYFIRLYSCEKNDSTVPNIIMSPYTTENSESLNDYVTNSGFSKVTTFSIE